MSTPEKPPKAKRVALATVRRWFASQPASMDFARACILDVLDHGTHDEARCKAATRPSTPSATDL